jgi:hypothetical protein
MRSRCLVRLFELLFIHYDCLVATTWYFVGAPLLLLHLTRPHVFCCFVTALLVIPAAKGVHITTICQA